MLGKERALEQGATLLRLVEGDAAEIVLKRQDACLTRYANSTIHQNVSHEDVTLSLRVVVDGGEGWAECNQLDERSVSQAAAVARQQASANRGSGEVIMAGPQTHACTPSHHASTIAFDPRQRAQAVAAICQAAQKFGFSAAGTVGRDVAETVMMNSKGLAAYQLVSEADIMAIVSGDEGSGFSRASSRDAALLDPQALGEEAVHRCRLNHKPQELPSGSYPVVLAPYATADLVMVLSAMALGAGEVQQGSSFMATSQGERVFHPQVTLWDDGLDMRGLPLLFDSEGVAKQRVELIAQGRPVSPVHDLTTGERAGTPSTGHASFRGAGSPFAANLFLADGEGNLDSLVSQLDRGVLITRFHYLAMVHPGQTRWSGMTRDGTFLIEGGRIAKALRNLRFDDRIVDQLAGEVHLGGDVRTVKGFPGCAHVPSMLLERFNFTGSTL